MSEKKLSLDKLKLQSFSTEVGKDSEEIRQKVAGSGALTGCGGLTCVDTGGCNEIYTDWSSGDRCGC